MSGTVLPVITMDEVTADQFYRVIEGHADGPVHGGIVHGDHPDITRLQRMPARPVCLVLDLIPLQSHQGTERQENGIGGGGGPVQVVELLEVAAARLHEDRKSTRLNSSH